MPEDDEAELPELEVVPVVVVVEAPVELLEETVLDVDEVPKLPLA